MTTTPHLLKAYRASLGLSQSQLAAKWGVSLRTLQDIEQGLRRKNDGVLIALLQAVLAQNSGKG